MNTICEHEFVVLAFYCVYNAYKIVVFVKLNGVYQVCRIQNVNEWLFHFKAAKLNTLSPIDRKKMYTYQELKQNNLDLEGIISQLPFDSKWPYP